MRFMQIFILCFLCFMLATCPLFGDTKGKLAGLVIDQDTGKPMSGVDIFLEGTNLKTETDQSGEYFIINLTPGYYEIKAFFLGYVPVVKMNVFVSAGHTTRINFSLSSTIIEIGKNHEYTLQRPLILKNENFSSYELLSDDVTLQPVDSYAQLLRYLPGVTPDARNRMHIRGGRSNELAFFVDGIPQNEPFMNRQAYDFPISDIHEMIIQDGSFGAEFGNAASGVVQIVSKEIPKKYTGSMTFQTGDDLTMHSDIFTDGISEINMMNNWQVQAAFGGPFPKYLSDKLFFRFSTRFWDDGGYIFGLDKYTTAGEIKSDSPDEVALNPWRQFTLGFDMIYNLKSNMDLEYRSGYQHQRWQDVETLADLRWSQLPDGRRWKMMRSASHYLKFTHQPSDQMYYSFIAGYLWDRYRQHAFSNIDDEEYITSGFLSSDMPGEFFVSGTDNFRLNQNSNSLISKFDLTKQHGNRHLLQTGFEIKLHDVTYHQYSVEKDIAERDNNKDGIIGNSTANVDSLNDAFRHHPTEFACYFQDKIEWHSVVLTLGGRLEGFMPDAEPETGWWQNSADSTYKATNKFVFSPRIGVAYNISEQGKLFSTYGHYYQTPPFWGLYTNPENQIYSSNYFSQMGNGDLKLQQTVSYEIGLEHKFEADAVARVKWFYRDFRNMMGRRIYLVPNALAYHSVWESADFGFSQGAIVRITKKFSETLQVDVDYTYQHTKMNNPEPAPDEIMNLNQFEQRSLTRLYLADWDQPHALQLHLAWSHPKKWGMSLHGRVASGYPYTEKAVDPLRDTAIYNSSRGPVQVNLDLSAFKTFPIWIGYNESAISLEFKAYNLLDGLNEKVVWPSSGNAERPLEALRAGQSEEWLARPHWYSRPRQVFVGLKYMF